MTMLSLRCFEQLAPEHLAEHASYLANQADDKNKSSSFDVIIHVSNVMTLNFRTDLSDQIVQTQIRSRLIRAFNVCYAICIFFYKTPQDLTSLFETAKFSCA